MKNKRILFVYQNFSSFVRTDFEILSIDNQVKTYQFKPGKGLLQTAATLFRQFVFLIIQSWKFDAVYIWFADYHSFLPVVVFSAMHKKAFVVIGGYDVCRIKTLAYGVFSNKLRGFFAITTMKLCTVNITVSAHVDRKVKYIAPSANRKLIYNCVHIKTAVSDLPREKLLLTVAKVTSRSTFVLKGIDRCIALAKQLPDYTFVVVGLSAKTIMSLSIEFPGNMQILGIIPHDELHAYYSKARFYCQLSRSESFGVAVAEALLLGCIPLVTEVGGLPELVGDKKYILDPSFNGVEQQLSKLLLDETPTEEQYRRERVLTLFNFETRKEKLGLLLNEYLNGKAY